MPCARGGLACANRDLAGSCPSSWAAWRFGEEAGADHTMHSRVPTPPAQTGAAGRWTDQETRIIRRLLIEAHTSRLLDVTLPEVAFTGPDNQTVRPDLPLNYSRTRTLCVLQLVCNVGADHFQFKPLRAPAASVRTEPPCARRATSVRPRGLDYFSSVRSAHGVSQPTSVRPPALSRPFSTQIEALLYAPLDLKCTQRVVLCR